MKTWADFYDLVLPDVPGCLTAAADAALRQAAITFFAETGVWSVWLDAETTVLEQDTYDYDVGCDAQVHRLISAKLGNDVLPVLRPDQHENGVLDVARKQFKVTPQPLPDLSLSVEVSLKPTQTAVGVLDEHYDQFQEAIVHGALARLMVSPKKPYTDLALAGMHEAKFRQACDMQAYKQFKGHGSSVARVTGQFF